MLAELWLVSVISLNNFGPMRAAGEQGEMEEDMEIGKIKRRSRWKIKRRRRMVSLNKNNGRNKR